MGYAQINVDRIAAMYFIPVYVYLEAPPTELLLGLQFD